MISPSLRRLLPRVLLLIAGLVLGIGLIVLLFRSVDLDQLGTDLQDVDYLYLALAVPAFLVNWLVKVPRWALLYGDDAPSYDTLFGGMNVGYAVNTLLPARLGEIVRAYWVRDRAQIGMVHTLSTIALERVTDGVTLLILFAIVAPTVALPHRLIAPAISIGVLFVGALIVMGFLAYSAAEGGDRFGLLQRLDAGPLARVSGILRQVLTGLTALRDKKSLALLLLYTALIWASNIVLLHLVLLAFHIHVPITAAVLLTAILNLGMAVPSTPGYIGVFDGLMVLGLGLYGVHRTPALAAALVFHAISFVPVTVVGIIYLARAGAQVTMQMLRASAAPGEREPAGMVGRGQLD